MNKTLLTAIVLTIAFAFGGMAPAQNLSRDWEYPTQSKHFPRFVSSDLKYNILLNDLMKRHWYAEPGPGALSGGQQTSCREWNALATTWIDTSKSLVNGRDYNLDLKRYLQTIQMDNDGYVYSYHLSGQQNRIGLATPDYKSSAGLSKGWGWDSSSTGQDGWIIAGGGSLGVANGLWNVILTEPDSYVEINRLSIDAFQSPFLIIGIGTSIPCVSYIQWTTEKEPEWSDDNSARMMVTSSTPADFYIPVYQLPGWTGKITGLRIVPTRNVPEDGLTMTLDRVHCAYDTRQAINNASFILASARYYLWSGDDDFLKSNIDRIRAAAHYMRSQLKGDKDGMITIPYWGQDGTSGTGEKPRIGHGISSDYWLPLPMGHKSAYTNAYYIASLKAMAEIENAAFKLNIKTNPYEEDAASFKRQAESAAKTCSEFFWNDEKGRFVGCEDTAGKRHDYGFAYLNLEALFYGMGDAKKADSIYSWLDGKRAVVGDTSNGSDIYKWRFAPRSTTLLNPDWYSWIWRPTAKEFGDQFFNGGAALYTSFYDIMNRIEYKTPDDAYERMKVILDWYADVWDQGGYSAYFNRLGHTAENALAIDGEFAESVLVPMAYLYGFLGINATSEGLVIEPKLPSSISRAGVQNLTYWEVEMTVLCEPEKITIKCTSNPKNKSFRLNGRRVTGTFERELEVSRAVLVPG